jgi:hypothetical protein
MRFGMAFRIRSSSDESSANAFSAHFARFQCSKARKRSEWGKFAVGDTQKSISNMCILNCIWCEQMLFMFEAGWVRIRNIRQRMAC